MLILSRRKDETIVIRVGGAKIVVKVCSQRPPYTRLGIKAPPEVQVNRGEIDERIQAEKNGAHVHLFETVNNRVPATCACGAKLYGDRIEGAK